MIRMVNAPEAVHFDQKLLFLAGGITGCSDWQTELYVKLVSRMPSDWCVLNPRRAEYTDSREIAKQQIVWEFNSLLHSDLISFWFPKDSVCPIALFELGRWSTMSVPLVIGCDPDYPRRFDIEVQMGLTVGIDPVVYDLNSLADGIVNKAKDIGKKVEDKEDGDAPFGAIIVDEE